MRERREVISRVCTNGWKFPLILNWCARNVLFFFMCLAFHPLLPFPKKKPSPTSPSTFSSLSSLSAIHSLSLVCSLSARQRLGFFGSGKTAHISRVVCAGKQPTFQTPSIDKFFFLPATLSHSPCAWTAKDTCGLCKAARLDKPKTSEDRKMFIIFPCVWWRRRWWK